MQDSLKKKILYSDVITQLIISKNVLAIYLGGSRLYGLDSPESDYDIIVISKPNTLFNFNRKRLDIGGFKMHILICPIDLVLDTIKNYSDTTGFQPTKTLLDILYGVNDFIVYSTPAFNHIKNVVLKHYDAIAALALENNILNMLSRISFPITKYHKIYYHWLLTIFMFDNFKKNNSLTLTSTQKKLLVDIKASQALPPILYESFKTTKHFKQLTYLYNYKDIYKEVSKYE